MDTVQIVPQIAENIDILSIGETVIDLTPAGVSKQGNNLYEKQPGGAPANMMTQASLLGAKTCINGLVGDDPFGRYLAKVLESKGISTEGLIYSNKYPTHCAILELDENGERSFFSIQTESSLYSFTKEDIRYDLLDRAKIIHIAGAYMSKPGPLSAVTEIVEYAQEKKKLISCDINWRPFMYQRSYAQRYILPVLQKISLLKLSIDELELFTDTRDAEKGAAILAETGVPFIVVTLGEEGCFFRYANGAQFVQTFPVEVLDTNAAGDAFMGVLLKHIAEYEKLEDISCSEVVKILSVANAAGALCVTKSGAICAMSTADEIENFIKKK